MNKPTLFNPDDVLAMARAITKSPVNFFANSNGADFYCCDFCDKTECVHYEKSRPVCKKFVHSPDCVVLVATDVLTNAQESEGLNK